MNSEHRWEVLDSDVSCSALPSAKHIKNFLGKYEIYANLQTLFPKFQRTTLLMQLFAPNLWQKYFETMFTFWLNEDKVRIFEQYVVQEMKEIIRYSTDIQRLTNAVQPVATNNLVRIVF